MSIRGWSVDLSSPKPEERFGYGEFAVPPRCASCLAPDEVRVEVTGSSGGTGIVTVVRASFPYCRPCAARARRDTMRGTCLLVATLPVSVAVIVGWWRACDYLSEWLAGPAGVAAVVLTAAILLLLIGVTHPRQPPAPATSRGRAVFALGATKKFLFTNEEFANRLAHANRCPIEPDRRPFAGVTAIPLLGALFAALLLVLGFMLRQSYVTNSGDPHASTSPGSHHAPSKPASKAPPRR